MWELDVSVNLLEKKTTLAIVGGSEARLSGCRNSLSEMVVSVDAVFRATKYQCGRLPDLLASKPPLSLHHP